MAELNGSGSSSGSDGSSQSSSSNLHTPPPERSKSSTKRHRGHKYKTKKRHKESRKRKGKGSSSALSHDSTESTSSDSDHETAKKHKESHKRRRQQSHKHSQSSTPQLTIADHHRVTESLRELDNDQLIGVGMALGLYCRSLKRMKDLLGNMVSAWLREENNVTVASGSPSWASLATTLENMGHKRIASKIRKAKPSGMAEEEEDIEQPKLKDDDEEYRDKFWPADPPTPDEADYENLQKFCDKVDVLIHVVNENELKAALRHMDPPCSPYERPVENFPEAPFIIGLFAKKKAALVQTDQGARCRGNIENAVTVFKNAQCILLVGFGYAFNRKYKLGDVLVSNSISDMMVWKFTKEGTVQNRGQTIDVEDFLRNIFCMNTSLKKPFIVSTSGRESKVHCGQFVSFSALMDNEYERNKFHKACDYAIGGEMEGGVVREVSKKKDNNVEGIIIIKGVVDYADDTKEKDWQFTSAMAAFNYTKSKLEKATLLSKVDRSLTTQTATPPSPEMSSAFSRFRNYLKSYYNTNPVARDDKLSIAPCSEFISLALIKKDKSVSKDDTFSQSTLYGGRDQISAHKVPLELDGILTSESKFVLVEGAPGIGKSTLSWELCRKWDTLKCLQHYSIVLLLKLREGRVQNASSLNELFYHDDKALCESVVSEVLRCNGEGVLLILDGFDEMPASVVRNKESLIMRVISGSCIPRATCLVTSRPSALHHTKCFPQEFRHVEIVGFIDENIEKFAEIAFKSEPNVLLEFKKFIFSNPIIKSLMYIPANCAILAQSYKDIMRSSKQVPKTTTQLYTMLTRILIRRHLIAIGRWDEYSKVPDLKDLPEDVKGDLERVSKLAYTGLFNEDIQLVFTDSDVGEGFHTLGLLSEVKEMYVCEGARTSYSFLHLSIQEFLAAWHVSCHQKLVKEALAKTLREDSPHLHVFGRILAGLTEIIDLYKKYLMEWYRKTSVLYACHCLYEAQNKSSNIFENFNLYVNLSTPLDMYVFGYCLAYVAHQWPQVAIRSSIDMLVSSLADCTSNEVLGSIKELELAESSSSSTHKLKDLPHSLLYSIKKLVVDNIPLFPLLEGMPVLQNVQEIITYDTEMRINDCSWSIIKKFPDLKVLKLNVKISERGACDLIKAIASNSNMEEIELSAKTSHNNDYEYRLDSLAQAALSCPSLKRLYTEYPFVVSNNTSPKNLQNIEITGIEQLQFTKLPRLFDCLYSIASVCKVSSVQTIVIIYSRLNLFSMSLSSLPCDCVGGYYDCISLLNVCLHHHWSSMKKLELPFSIPCTQFHLSSLSRALRRDPDTSQLKLRRSKSLSDLVCLKTLDKHARKHCTDTNPTLQDIGKHTPVVKKTESCPDLVGFQSLHPLMAEELFEGSNSLHLTPH